MSIDRRIIPQPIPQVIDRSLQAAVPQDRPRDEYGNFTKPSILSPQRLAELVAVDVKSTFWSVITNEDGNTPVGDLFKGPEHLHRNYTLGPIYRFRGRPDVTAYTLSRQLRENSKGGLSLNILLQDAGEPNEISAVDMGELVFHNRQKPTIYAGATIATLGRGKGLATLTELAWLAEVARLGAINNARAIQYVADGNGDRMEDVKKIIEKATTHESRGEAEAAGIREMYMEILARYEHARPGWKHLWGANGIIGVQDGRVLIEPDFTLCEVGFGLPVLLERQMVYSPEAHREIVRPKATVGQPVDPITYEAVFDQVVRLLDNTKNKIYP